MTEKETAEAIIQKYIKILGSQCEHESYCKSKECNVLGFTHCKVDLEKAKECAKSEVEAIIDLPIFWSESGSQVAKDNGIESTQEFWQGVLSEIK